jgi:hypothetical protein
LSQQKKTRFCFIEAENGSSRNKNEKTHQKAEIKALLRCSKKKPAFASLKQKKDSLRKKRKKLLEADLARDIAGALVATILY